MEKEKIIRKLKHFVGLDSESKLYHRKGKTFYKAYRNYWQSCFPEDDLEELCSGEYGFIEKFESDDFIYYRLTKKGLQWLGDEIGINIKT